MLIFVVALHRSPLLLLLLHYAGSHDHTNQTQAHTFARHFTKATLKKTHTFGRLTQDSPLQEQLSQPESATKSLNYGRPPKGIDLPNAECFFRTSACQEYCKSTGQTKF